MSSFLFQIGHLFNEGFAYTHNHCKINSNGNLTSHLSKFQFMIKSDTKFTYLRCDAQNCKLFEFYF